MITVAVQDELVDILTVFGDLQKTVDDALHRYTIEQISSKISELRQKDAAYRARYGMTYPVFAQRIAEDEAFVQYVEDHINKMWETDFADWEYCYKGIQDWAEKLRNILSI